MSQHCVCLCGPTSSFSHVMSLTMFLHAQFSSTFTTFHHFILLSPFSTTLYYFSKTKYGSTTFLRNLEGQQFGNVVRKCCHKGFSQIIKISSMCFSTIYFTSPVLYFLHRTIATFKSGENDENDSSMFKLLSL